MATEVKWIKITTNMFDDEKIKLISAMPESDAILVIWVRLLALAGKCNAGGYIYFTDSIPYTDDMLATIFNKPVSIIRLALQTFEQFGMIEIDEKGIYLVNFEKYQNIDGLEKIRESNRLSSAKYREKQRLLKESDSDITITSRQNTDNISISPSNSISKSINKIKYEEFVSMTEEEYNKLVEQLGEDITKEWITDLNLWKGSKGKKTKSDYLTILSWDRKCPKKKEEDNW